MNRYDTIRKNAERQAQAMIDRQVPENDPPCLADWLETQAGKDWQYENGERVYEGRPIYETESFGIGRLAVVERIKFLGDSNWHDLPDADKDAVNCWTEWCDAQLVGKVTRNKDDQFLAAKKYNELDKHIQRIADELVDGIAQRYFDKYILGEV
jgi:hypothetical protein